MGYRYKSLFSSFFPFFPFFFPQQKWGRTVHTILNLRISRWHYFRSGILQICSNYFISFYHHCILLFIFQSWNINLEVCQGFGLCSDFRVYDFQVFSGSELCYLLLQVLKVVASYHLTWANTGASPDHKVTKLEFSPIAMALFLE